MLENVNEYMFMSVVNHALIGMAIKLFLNVEIYIRLYRKLFYSCFIFDTVLRYL